MLEKTCTKCYKTKSILFFHGDRTKKDGYRSSCKDCNNKSDIRLIKFIDLHDASCVSKPLTKVCPTCNTLKSTEAFDNDSTKRDGKKSSCKVCRRVYANAYVKRPEVAKRIAKYASEYNSEKNKKRREKINRLKQRYGCIDCGYNKHPVALHFDHIDPTKKTYAISQIISSSLKTIFKEIRKCVVRCANCHAIKTVEEKDHLTRRNELHTGSRR